MARSENPVAGRPEPQALLHRAARIEDSVHALRERRARARGQTPTVIPYTGYGHPGGSETGWIRVLARVLLVKPRPQRDASPYYRTVRGWRSFTSVPLHEVDVTITAGGQEFRVTSDRGGVVDTRIEVALPAGWNTIQLRTDESATVDAAIYVVAEGATFGMVSDIDDTVMVTSLPRPLLAAWNTFVLDEHARRPVAGMAVMYDRIVRAHAGAPVIYLSTGAWNVAPTLRRFMSRNLYPAGALLLTDWGPTTDRLFRSGREHKRDNLDRLAEEFPGIKWLLVGDDGQHDEDLYAEFARVHPTNLSAVCIRQLSTSEAVFAGGRSANAEHSPEAAPWIYAPDGAGLSARLTEVGLLPSDPQFRSFRPSTT